MPNLVGIGNSQVPTNAMLGGFAYQNSVGEIDIEKIKAKTVYDAQSSGGTGLFVYDTRKDSDGGAWRYRTQNTTWYNEGASSKRGARKEFPAVAVLVVSEDDNRAIHIYDGDDPNLSMWMIIDSSDSQWPLTEFSSITALNGIIALGSDSSEQPLYETRNRLDLYYFISDKIESSGGSSGGNYYGTLHGLINRRDHARSRATAGLGNSVYNLVHMRVKDVAMTVLPNAPIDDATGLPVPTIAVATAGGVSIIKDDRSIVNITVSSALLHHEPRNISFLGSSSENANDDGTTTSSARLLWTEGNNYDLQDRAYLNAPIPTSSIALTHGGALPAGFIGYGVGGKASNIYNNTVIDSTLDNDSVSPRERKFQIAGPDGTIILGCKHFSQGGLEQIHQDIDSPSNGALNVITTSYNSGWLHGDCKVAVLSDTDTTNISGSNLMSGATYNTSARVDSYSYSNGSSTLVINDQQSSSDGYVNLSLTGLTASTNYVMMVTANQSYTPTSGYNHHIGNTSDGTVYFEDNFVGTTSVQKVTFKTSSNNAVPTIVLYSGYNGALTYTMDLRLAEFDCSIGHFSAYNAAQNGLIGQRDGLAVYGTIEKHAVATGAELVSYRPNSSSMGDNYLRMPLKATEFYLTGDWSINFWAKNNGNTAANYSGWEIAPDDISTNSAYSIIPISMYIQNDGVLGLRGMNGNANQDASGKPLATAGDWRCFNLVQRSGTTYLYIDGELNISRTVSYTNPSSAYSLYLFGWSYSTTRYTGRRQADLSLFRLSETAPTAKMVKKMFEDEKKLFIENAKCTLYGTTNVVTAIAHDDKTGVVHVGTASGRSEFRGLNRINNTTIAVTTAISASNELVAEQ